MLTQGLLLLKFFSFLEAAGGSCKVKNEH